MTRLYKTVRWLLIGLLFCPALALAELPRADNRPFWTQKSCYREGEMVFAVGLSMGNRSLEAARKASFQAALWEISNFAQIRETSLLLVETQMTYEEQNPDSSYSVWRLVKIPFPMIEKARQLLIHNAPSTQSTVLKIKKLANQDRDDLADALRRALLEEDGKREPPLKRDRRDRTHPTGSVEGIHATYQPHEVITLTFRVADDRALQTLLFTIEGSPLKKTWAINGKNAVGRVSFPASRFEPGKQVYSMKITDAAGNVTRKRGIFHIADLHDELYDLLSREID